jgi:hypothetical protein
MEQLIISGVDLMMRTAMRILGKKNDLKPQLVMQDAVQDRSDGNADEDRQPKIQ